MKDKAAARYIIVFREPPTPVRMRISGKPQDHVVWWRSKEEVLEFLAHSAYGHIGEFEVFELSEIGEDALAKMLSLAPEGSAISDVNKRSGRVR